MAKKNKPQVCIVTVTGADRVAQKPPQKNSSGEKPEYLRRYRH